MAAAAFEKAVQCRRIDRRGGFRDRHVVALLIAVRREDIEREALLGTMGYSVDRAVCEEPSRDGVVGFAVGASTNPFG